MPAIETLERDVAPPDLVWMIGEGAAPPVASQSISPLPALGEGRRPRPCGRTTRSRSSIRRAPRGLPRASARAGADVLVGRLFGARARHPRGRCAVHDAAAVPHQCAERVLSGAPERLHLRARAEILRLRFLGGGATASGDRRLSPRRDGRDAAGAAEIRRHRAFPAGRARRRRPRSISRAVSRASACRCSTATARPKRISCSQAPSRPIAPARWAISSRAWRPASPVPTTRLSLTVRPASCCSREPLAFSTGYFEMPDKTAEAWRNLWFHTGDRVVRDADGHYRFVDRMKFRSAGAARCFILGGGAGAAEASGDRCLRRLSAAVRARRG